MIHSSDYLEFETLHLPALFPHVVVIASQDEDGNECIGSGVLVCINERHFVATARHCVERDPRVFSADFIMLENNDTKNVRFQSKVSNTILKIGMHPELDIAFLEIRDPVSRELTYEQLFSPKKLEGTVHVIGHPASRIMRSELLKEIVINKCAFGTNAIQITDDSMKLGYPVNGCRSQGGEWVSDPFPDPYGFSGGGCFGVTKSTQNSIEVIQYNLLGIQSSWCQAERWVRVIPIRKWMDLIDAELAT